MDISKVFDEFKSYFGVFEGDEWVLGFFQNIIDQAKKEEKNRIHEEFMDECCGKTTHIECECCERLYKIIRGLQTNKD